MSDQIQLRHVRIDAAYQALAALGETATEEQRMAAEEEVSRLEAIPHTLAELTAEYAQQARTCRGPRSEEGDKLVTAAFEAGDLEEAKRLDALHRQPCGQDVNALILAAGVFGKDHAVTCPKCGRTIEYRTPTVEG